MLMKAESPGGQAQLKRGNRMAIIRQLRVHPGQSRVDLTNALGLTKSTVSALVRELIDEGWLLEREVLVTGDLGRRPTPLFVDPTRLLLLGTQVGIGYVRVVLTSLTGDVLSARSASYDTSLDVEACILELTRTMLAVAARRGEAQRIIGIGVGLPGGVDQARDQLVFAPHVHWHQAPFGALLREALHGTPLSGVPVFMQNDADVAAWLATARLDADARVRSADLDLTLADLLQRSHLPEPEGARGQVAQAVADALRPLPHREYSIASLPPDGSLQLLVRQMLRNGGRLGSGSGWLLAMMSHIVGSRGRVVGVELLPEIAAASRLRLAALGCKAEVVTGDAAVALPPHERFDRQRTVPIAI